MKNKLSYLRKTWSFTKSETKKMTLSDEKFVVRIT